MQKENKDLVSFEDKDCKNLKHLNKNSSAITISLIVVIFHPNLTVKKHHLIKYQLQPAIFKERNCCGIFSLNVFNDTILTSFLWL